MGLVRECGECAAGARRGRHTTQLLARYTRGRLPRSEGHDSRQALRSRGAEPAGDLPACCSPLRSGWPSQLPQSARWRNFQILHICVSRYPVCGAQAVTSSCCPRLNVFGLVKYCSFASLSQTKLRGCALKCVAKAWVSSAISSCRRNKPWPL